MHLVILARIGIAAEKTIRRFGRQTDGMAIAEFALLLPLLLLIYVGTCAVTSAVSASRSTTILSRTLTDLVSQQQANVPLTDTTMQNIFAAATTVMAPFTTTNLKMTVSNIEFVVNAASTGSNGLDAKARWTVSFSGGTLRPCGASGTATPILTPVPNGTGASPTTLPVGLYTAGFLIIADVTYVYTPSFGYFSYNFATGKASGTPVSFTMSRTSYMRPRQTDNIRYTAGTAGSTASICTIASPQTS